MNKVLILIGMSGSGKTTAGEALARACSCDFFDTDLLIENEIAKKTIEQIFQDHGEYEFRRLEKAALAGILQSSVEHSNDSTKTKMVVATGGGLPLFEDNFARLASLGTIVYLKCETEILARRLIEQFKSEKKERPMINLASGSKNESVQEGLNKKLLELLQSRAQTYEKADHCIDTTHLTPSEVVERLKAFL
ncbi:MAG: shikimate kinase [Cyanobacteria bacterium TGS_CYA1]|nr:shikimate kinase [Cyanobacteria bacterium TGS_CYA1]